jgi:hypothetical protein
MNFVINRMKLIHARLDAEVLRELSTRFPDQGRVARLKKLKLAVKDKLAQTTPRAMRAG